MYQRDKYFCFILLEIAHGTTYFFRDDSTFNLIFNAQKNVTETKLIRQHEKEANLEKVRTFNLIKHI